MDAHPSPDGVAFRRVLGQFATGVTIVTTCLDGCYHGITVNSFCSVSLDPLLVLVCLDRKSHSLPLIAKSGVFAVNVLSHVQQEWANRFAGRGEPVTEDFAGVPHRTASTGAPLLLHSLAWLDCRIVGRFDGGDHEIVLGTAVEYDLGESQDPLLFYRGHYSRVHH